MTEEKKMPGVPADEFTSSYWHLVNANYLFPQGSQSSSDKQTGREIPDFKPQQNYAEEISLWNDTMDILKNLLDQETKVLTAQKIVGLG
jgi:hypothetical protein